jgi:hypothetical protein
VAERRYVYRLVVDKWPTADGKPFVDQPLEWWELVVDAWSRMRAGDMAADYPEWMPDDLMPYLPCKPGFDYPAHLDPPKFTHRVGDDGEPREPGYPGCPGYDVLAVPAATPRRRFQSAGLIAAAKQLRQWGCRAHVERAEVGKWETI